MESKEEKALAEFKKNVSDIPLSRLPEHDDNFFLRWLRARNFNLKKSEDMLRKHLECRKKYQIDDILDWKIPTAIKEYFPGGWCGEDREGSPVAYYPLGKADFRGILHSVKPSVIMKLNCLRGEMALNKCREQSQRLAKSVDGVVLISDLEGLNIRSHLWKPTIDVMTEAFALMEANYPEVLKHVIVVNAPKIFPICFGIIKPLLSERTKQRIKILGRNWRSDLLAYISPDQLVKHYGGTRCDSTGDPMCKENICYGGTVPRHFYASECGAVSGMTDEVKQITVGRGSFHLIDVEVSVAGSVISWEYKTSGHDIGFGLYFKGQIDSTVAMTIDEMDEMIKISREDCFRVPVDGTFQAILAGTYVLCFDNRHSWIFSKTLFYAIHVHPPTDDFS
ncbi:SEC14-like protein 2 isoform X2 [Oscarella lobularis]|uniref:SEC14-like protein 2 isoform X2 n=1 Tax=Oscarella lobularis TaxID=121494 RepID=UPI0033135EEA